MTAQGGEKHVEEGGETKEEGDSEESLDSRCPVDFCLLVKFPGDGGKPCKQNEGGEKKKERKEESKRLSPFSFRILSPHRLSFWHDGRLHVRFTVSRIAPAGLRFPFPLAGAHHAVRSFLRGSR